MDFYVDLPNVGLI